MQWYYAVGTDRKGPVDETQLQALIATGTVSPESLVWHAQLDGWKTAVSVGLFGDARATTARAAAALAEPDASAADGPNALRDGRRIVVPVKGARLPRRCVKTNEPVEDRDLRRKTLYWCTPWVLFSILLSLLVTLILYLILRKKVELDLPLSRAGRGQVNRHIVAFLGVVAAGGALFFHGLSHPGSEGLAVLGFAVCLGGLIYGAIKGNALRVAKIEHGRAWLLGASDAYLETLPPYRPDR